MKSNSPAPILLKLTGSLFAASDDHQLSATFARSLAQQIKQLSSSVHFGIVMGGGNFFRGSIQGKQLGLAPDVGHQVGMLATLMNALMLHAMFQQEGVAATLLSAIDCPSVGQPISRMAITDALQQGKTIIFAGGIGTPFFTTDTAAVVRALQLNARELWKATAVDGVYTTDPQVDVQARPIKRLTHTEALEKKLGIMDATSLLLADAHQLPIRVFNIFETDALIRAHTDKQFGSLIFHGGTVHD